MSREVLGGGRNASTLFDLGLYLFTFLAPIFFWLPYQLNMVQKLFFVYGVLFLFALTFISKRQKEIKHKEFTFIILWSLISVFLHNFRIYPRTAFEKFLCFSTMTEGFLYVWCGVMLYWMVVTYKKKFNIFYPILGINLLNLFFVITQSMGIKLIWSNNLTISGMMGQSSQLAIFSAISIPILGKRNYLLAVVPIVCLLLANSYTALCAFYIAVFFYLIRQNWIENGYRKMFIWTWIILGGLFFLFKYQPMWLRFDIRLETWGIAFWEIIRSPLIGHGFDNTLTFNMVKSIKANGFVYRHNDYLNIAKDLGLPFLGFIIYSIYKILRNTKINYLTVSIWILLISCYCQTNFYFPRVAIIGIMLLALKECEVIDV